MVAIAEITLVLLSLLIWTKNFNSEAARKKELKNPKPLWMEDLKGFTSSHDFLWLSPETAPRCSVPPFALSSWLNGCWVMFRHLWFPAMWPTLLNFLNLFSKALYHFACHTHPKGSYQQEMRHSLCKMKCPSDILNWFVCECALVRVTPSSALCDLSPTMHSLKHTLCVPHNPFLSGHLPAGLASKWGCQWLLVPAYAIMAGMILYRVMISKEEHFINWRDASFSSRFENASVKICSGLLLRSTNFLVRCSCFSSHYPSN